MATLLHVLILEDRPADVELVLERLRLGGFEPDWRHVVTEAEYRTALDPALDVILADYCLPDLDALRALHLLQESGLDIPFIVITGSVGEELAVECIKEGAADYLLKDRLARLGPAVAHALEQKRFRQEKQRAEEALRESQRLLQAVVDTAPSLIVLTDSEGRVVLFNRACEEMTGYRRDEVIGNMIAELFLPSEWIPVVQKRFADPYAPEVRAPHENPWLTKAGEQRLIEWRCIPLLWDSAGTYILATGVDVTDRKQAEEALRQQVERLDALRQVGLELTSELDLDSLLRSIVSRAVQLLRGASGGLYLHRPERDLLEWTVAAGPRMTPVGHVLHRGEGLSGRVWETGVPLLVDDYRCWEGRAAMFEDYPFMAVVGVPVRWGDEFLGVLNVMAEPPRAFTSADAELLALFATQAAIAIRNARTLVAIDQQRRHAEALVRASTALTSTLELEGLLENVLAAAIRAIPVAEKGSVLLRDEESGELRIRALVGYSDPRIREARFPREEGYSAQAEQEGRPLLIPDARTGPIRYDGEIEEMRAIQSAIVAPLRYREQVIGCLSLDNASRKRAFTEEDLSLLAAFAAQTAVAVENARLFEETRNYVVRLERKTKELELVHQVSQMIGASLDLTRILDTTVEQVVGLFEVDHSGILLFDQAGTHGQVVAEYPATGTMGERFPVQGYVAVERILAKPEPLVVEDTWYDPLMGAVKEAMQRWDIRSMLIAPLVVEGEVIGSLGLDTVGRQRRFSAEEVALAQTIANQAAIAIGNARLFKEVCAGRGQMQALSRQLVETQESERSYIARELHDQVGQLLTGLKLTLEIGKRLPAEAIKDGLTEAQSLVDDLIRRVREMALDLRPSLLDDLGLLPALLWYFERYTTQTNVRVIFEQTGLERRLAPHVETGAYRIVQEALTNVARHAGVSEVEVRAQAGPDTLNLLIEDRGVGFDPRAILSDGTGSGLSGMRERAAALGGRLWVESARRAGTRVTAELPVGRR